MLKLLKYDWKRNASAVLGLMAILLITQILLNTVGFMNNWNNVLVLILSMLAYGLVIAILLVIVSKTFDRNLKLYNRRLLPVRSVWSILSSLIEALISMIVLMAVVILHIWIFWNMGGLGSIFNLSDTTTSDYVLTLLAAGWKFIFLFLSIFLAIVVARSTRKQWGVWVGILFFFILHNVIQWLEYNLFRAGDAWVGSFFSITVERGEATTMINNETLLVPIGPFLFELLLAGLFVYAMIYLIDRKVEA